MDEYQSHRVISAGKTVIVLFLGTLVLSLSACSLFSSKTEEPEEGTELKAAVDKPEAELFESAQKSYASGLYSVAVQSYQSIRDGYPLGPYAEYAELKAADCHFEMGDYDLAAGFYAEFHKNHPASAAAPYALIRAGRAYELANRGIGRDPSSLQKSLEHFVKLRQQFPGSPYAEAGKVFEEETRGKLAAHEKLVIDFYERNAKKEALEARKRDFEQRWGKQSDAVEQAAASPESLEPQALQNDQAFEKETRAAGKPISEPRPETSSPQSADRVVVGQEPVPFTNEEGQALESLSQAKNDTGPVYLRLVECKPDTKTISIYLTRPLNDSVFEARGGLRRSADDLLLTVPELELPRGKESLELDCFRAGDLHVAASGEITLKGVMQLPGEESPGTEPPSFVNLTDPPRIVIALR